MPKMKYCYVNIKNEVVSPFFNTKKEAISYYRNRFGDIDYLESTILICSRNYYPAIDILEKISNGEKANKYCILLLADAYERTSQKEKAVVMLKAKSKEFFDDDISDRLAELCNMN